jgi:hypothetical protein
MNNLYYRPTVRTSRRNFRAKSGKFLKLLFPLGGILALGLLIWLLMQIWSFFADMKGTSFSDSAVIYVAEGTAAQKQNFGTTQYLPVLSGEPLLEGDSLRTLQNTRAVLEFPNGLVVRLDESTNVNFEKFENDKDQEVVHLKLLSGNLWLNKPESVKSASELRVSTNYMQANTIGTVFSVNAGLPESVYVVDGAVLVDIIDPSDDSDTPIDQVNVMASQQLNLDNAAFESFKRRETPRVLGAINEETRKSDWYEWNRKEDANPTQFSSDSALTNNTNYVSQVDESTSISDDLDATNDADEATTSEPDSTMPKVTFPKNGETINTETLDLTGTVPANTQAVVVTSFVSGAPNPYVLKGFKPGDLTYKYIAKYNSDGTGNLTLGTNKFQVVAVNEDGEESKPTTIEFEVEIEGQTPPADSAEDTQSNDVDVSQLEFSANLAAPVLVSVNGVPASSGYTLTTNRGEVSGSVGKWAKSVVVNGYKLSQYVPYSGEFTYILSPGFNTLKAGENKIVVYGFNDEGVRGTPATFIINWKP